MANYTDGFHTVKDANKIAAEAADVNARRITANNQHIFAGGGVVQAAQPPKIKHEAIFESAGVKFMVAELQQAFSKLPGAGRAEVAILSYADYYADEETAKDAQVCVVTWEN